MELLKIVVAPLLRKGKGKQRPRLNGEWEQVALKEIGELD